MDPVSIIHSDSRDEQEERHFSRLFKVILNKIINMEEIPENDIENAISQMKEGFKIFSFPDMIKWKNLCGYLFRYATHGAGLTRNRVLEAARESEALVSCLRSSDLRIVSLGGGPGNDIMGFCSALFECVGKGPSPNLNMTVIDRYEEWSICVTLLKKLVMEENFGNVSELLRFNDVRMSFLQFKLSASLMKDEDYFHFLQKADIILMVKLISLLDLRSVDCLMKILKENMKNEALLLYIDSPIQALVVGHFDVLFQSNLENYRMSCEVSKRFNSNDYVESKAQIAVLRKHSSPPSKRRRIE